MTSFWDRYGRPLLILVGAALIAYAGYLWWQQEQAQAAGVQAEEFDAALKGLDLGDPESIGAIEALAASDVPGYSEVSRLLAAGFLVDDGNIDGAIDAYRQIEGDVTVAQPLRDLAAIRAAQLAFDDVDPAELETSLAPLAEPGSPWFGVAGELLAAAYIKQGETDAAGSLYAAMAESNELPATLRDRASQMAASLSGGVDDEIAMDDPTGLTAQDAAETGADQ
ncbi:MAG: tetratricopeptide repeat protein [Pacificimonas sp.]|jgi:hypothetical protein|nr:tetratricopeptide repeat protein [Pacificimonas sp.]